MGESPVGKCLRAPGHALSLIGALFKGYHPPQNRELRLSARRTRDRGMGLVRQDLNLGLPDSLHSPSSSHTCQGEERLRWPEWWNLPGGLGPGSKPALSGWLPGILRRLHFL